jgi:hypothetical protein
MPELLMILFLIQAVLQGEFFPLQPLTRGYHPLDLDPVVSLLDQTAGGLFVRKLCATKKKEF